MAAQQKHPRKPLESPKTHIHDHLGVRRATRIPGDRLRRGRPIEEHARRGGAATGRRGRASARVLLEVHCGSESGGSRRGAAYGVLVAGQPQNMRRATGGASSSSPSSSATAPR